MSFRRIESLGRRINPWLDFRSYLELRQLVQDFKPDLIHTHTFKAGALCRIMYFKIPKVHTFHGHLLTDPEFSNCQKRIITTLDMMGTTIIRAHLITEIYTNPIIMLF